MVNKRFLLFSLAIAAIAVSLTVTACREQPDGTADASETAVPATGALEAVETVEITETAPASSPVAASPTAPPATETAAPLPTTTTTPGTNLTVTPAAVSSATPTPLPETFGISENVVLAVSYTIEGQSDGQLPAGQRRLVVVASVLNRGEQPLTIEREALTLIDREGERYTPEAPDERTQPPLVGASVSPGENLLGLVSFILPEGVDGESLEFCPGGPAACELPLTAPIS